MILNLHKFFIAHIKINSLKNKFDLFPFKVDLRKYGYVNDLWNKLLRHNNFKDGAGIGLSHRVDIPVKLLLIHSANGKGP